MAVMLVIRRVRMTHDHRDCLLMTKRRLIRGFKYGLGAIGIALALLVVVLVVRTVLLTSKQVPTRRFAGIDINERTAAKHLGGAVQIETVSQPDSPTDPPENDPEIVKFKKLHEYLRTTFPRVAETLTRESVGKGSLLLTWPGSNETLKPLLLLAHMDVVPAAGEDDESEAITDSEWGQLAFSGRVDDSFIWGRGTLDDKVSVVGLLEATEALVRNGFRPRRTLLLAFGRDEEVGGRNGARRIARLLRARGVSPECIIDEGSYILEGVVPGLNVAVAPVGVAEKGYVDIVLSVESGGGHSSLPGPHTAIGRLARAIQRVEDHPLPGRLDGICGETLAALGPEFPFLPRVMFANLWLFGPLLKTAFSASPPMNALIRTTTAVTLVRGGTKDNVLPSSAWALINFRLLPGDTSRFVLQHVKRAIDDPGVKVSFAHPAKYSEVFEASQVSPIDSSAYRVLQQTIRQTFPSAVVVPYLVTAGTDARHYEGLTPNIYRFLPVRLTYSDIERIHGTNERIARKDYVEVVQFYARLIQNFN
jgi:carboxypeptidase PM20D1